MFYLNDKALIKSGMKGIAFNSNSDFSKRLSASKELQNAINQDISQKNIDYKAVVVWVLKH